MPLDLSVPLDWFNSPGDWVRHYTIPEPAFPALPGVKYFTFIGEVRFPSRCMRFLNPQLLKDGRVLTSYIEEEGTPGQPGWAWHFYVTEPASGDVEFRVQTRECDGVV